jgi:hypothetical protein
MTKIKMRKGGYLSQNGEWISYKTERNAFKLAEINAFADDFLCVLAEEAIECELDSLRVARERLNNCLVLMVKSTDARLFFEESP